MIRLTFIYIMFIGTLNANIIALEMKTDAQVYAIANSITYIFE